MELRDTLVGTIKMMLDSSVLVCSLELCVNVVCFL